MNLLFNPPPVNPETLTKYCEDVGKNAIQQLFSSHIDGFGKSMREMLGGFTESLRKSDPELASHLDSVTLSGNDILDLFDDFLGELDNGNESNGKSVGELSQEVEAGTVGTVGVDSGLGNKQQTEAVLDSGNDREGLQSI